MYLSFAAVYLLPAGFFLLGIWMTLKLLAELGVGILARRVCFVILATLLLAPSVAGSIIVVSWVPNGLYLLAGSLPMLHQPRLVEFAMLSFIITAVIAFGIAWLVIRNTQSQVPTRKRRSRIAIPLAVIGLLLGFYYMILPDRKVADHIDWALVEAAYGHHMDAILATLHDNNIKDVRKERERLQQIFEQDPVYWSVSIDSSQSREDVFFSRQKTKGSSCTGLSPNRRLLMRCSLNIGESFDHETLRYRRSSLVNEQRHLVTVDFDYEVFSHRHESATTHVVDIATEIDQDRKLLGGWTLKRQFNRNPGGDRIQTAALKINQRRADGSFSIEADANTKTTPLENEPLNPRVCRNARGNCNWSSSSSGMLIIRGSRVQIVYDERHWFTDNLELLDGALVGTDPWGEPFQFERTGVRNQNTPADRKPTLN